MNSRGALALILAGTLAAPLAAQGPCGMNGPRLPDAGAWSEYQTARGTMRMAYLGHESGGDRLQMQMTTDRGAMIAQLLVDGFPFDASGIHEAVMKMGDRPAMKLPAEMFQRMGNTGGLTKEMCGDLTKVGSESVTVPAGTFHTTHYTFKSSRTVNGNAVTSSGDLWISSDVPFGMVKMTGTMSGGMRGDQPMTMTLTSTGKGATSAITEKPVEMGGMGGMMGGRPPRN